MLCFSTAFWNGGAAAGSSPRIFGRVCAEDEEEPEGFCNLFFDVSPQHDNNSEDDKEGSTKPVILMTYLSGAAAKLVETHTDDQIVKMCVAKLAKTFYDVEEEVSQYCQPLYLLLVPVTDLDCSLCQFRRILKMEKSHDIGQHYSITTIEND